MCLCVDAEEEENAEERRISRIEQRGVFLPGTTDFNGFRIRTRSRRTNGMDWGVCPTSPLNVLEWHPGEITSVSEEGFAVMKNFAESFPV